MQPDDCQDGSWVQLVNTATVAAPAGGMQYAALSHCWTDETSAFATTEPRLEATQGKIPSDTIPASFKDAISTAQGMGLRYLWIDSLCILRDSLEERKREVAAMASTYRNAAVCIVLESGPMISRWTTRSWVLQERLLSQRLLYLTGKQMYWECNALKASEALPHGLPSLLWEKIHNTTEITQRSPTKRRSKERITPGNHTQGTASASGLLDNGDHLPSECREECMSSRASPAAVDSAAEVPPLSAILSIPERNSSSSEKASSSLICNGHITKTKTQEKDTGKSAPLSSVGSRASRNVMLGEKSCVVCAALSCADSCECRENGNEGSSSVRRRTDVKMEIYEDVDGDMGMEMEMGG